MNTSVLLIANIIIGICSLALAVYAFLQFKKLRDIRTHFSADAQPENLEEIISSIARKLKALEQSQTATEEQASLIEQQLAAAVQKVGLHRFSGLGDNEEGGNLSFSLALLDESNNGVVITSVHGRQYSRIYTKEVTGSQSKIQLSDEEQAAIRRASQKLKLTPNSNP